MPLWWRAMVVHLSFNPAEGWQTLPTERRSPISQSWARRLSVRLPQSAGKDFRPHACPEPAHVPPPGRGLSWFGRRALATEAEGNALANLQRYLRSNGRGRGADERGDGAGACTVPAEVSCRDASPLIMSTS